MSSIGLGALLLAIWLLLWGGASAADVAGGLVVVGLVLWIVPDVGWPARRPTVRLGWALRFVGRVLVDLVRANAVLTREILSPGSSIATGVVRVPLTGCSDGVLTVVANVLALTPGTMPIDVEHDPAAISVHVLHLRDVEAVRHDITALATLAVRAFGAPQAVAALPIATSDAASDATSDASIDATFDNAPADEAGR